MAVLTSLPVDKERTRFIVVVTALILQIAKQRSVIIMKDLNKPEPKLIAHFISLAGLTPHEAAAKTGVTPMAVYNWTSGTNVPEASNLQKLADALGINISKFYAVKVNDLRMKATSVVDDYFDDPSYKKDGKARVATNIFQIPIDTTEEDIFEPVITNWRAKEMLPFTSPDAMMVKNHIGKPLVMVGPTRTSKTTLGLETVIGMHFANRGMRSFVCRQDAVDLSHTIRNDLRELSEYSLDDPISPICALGRGGSRNFKTLEINGGEMVLGGLNRDGSLLGTSFDVIFASQLEQMSEQSFAKMLTRCAGDAGNLQDENGDNYGLFLADCNPAPDSEHWILKYAEDERLILMNFGFENNPLYYDRHGDQTHTGKTVIGNLDTSLEGIFHDLYFKGLWADVAGKLFNFNDSVHLVDTPSNMTDYIWYRGIDFGIASPSVVMWLGVHRRDKSIYVHREFRKTKTDTIALGKEINFYTNEHVVNTIIDNDENAQIQLKRDCGIITDMTKKSATSVMDRVHILQNLLNRTLDGEDGGITFNKSTRCNNDPLLSRDKKPLSTIEEIKKLAADDNDKIIGSDHGFDALTYALLWLATQKKVSFGFGGGGSVKQQTRV